MTRTSISLPDDDFEALDEYRSDDMSWPDFFRDIVLPALNGEHVELTVEGALESDIADRLEDLEARVEELPAETSTRTAEEMERRFR